MKITYILFLILLLSAVVDCQTIEKGFKGIEPLKTNKILVDNLLGKPEVDDNGYFRYSSDDTFIRINYSNSLCILDPFERGKYNVPNNTVLDYYVVMKKPVELADIKYDPEKYTRDAGGDVVNFVDYHNVADGVTISVDVQKGKEYVREIRFVPSVFNAKNFKCPKLKSSPKLKKRFRH